MTTPVVARNKVGGTERETRDSCRFESVCADGGMLFARSIQAPRIGNTPGHQPLSVTHYLTPLQPRDCTAATDGNKKKLSSISNLLICYLELLVIGNNDLVIIEENFDLKTCVSVPTILS